MSDPYRQPAPAQPQHDTMVIPAGAAQSAPDSQPEYGAQPGYGASQGYGPTGQPQFGYPAAGYPGQPGNPEAAAWAAKYRRQRTWMRLLAAFVVVGMLAGVGIGFAVWQAVTSNPIVEAAQDLADGLDGSAEDSSPLDGLLPDGDTAPETEDAPLGELPDGGSSDSLPDGSLPLPEELQSLGDALGITDLRQLLDLAVSSGMMTEEQAAELEAALEAGATLGNAFPDQGEQQEG